MDGAVCWLFAPRLTAMRFVQLLGMLNRCRATFKEMTKDLNRIDRDGGLWAARPPGDRIHDFIEKLETLRF